MAYIVDTAKEFERPANGIYTGVVVDVIDLGIIQGKNPAFAAKPKVLIQWALNAKDSKGNLFLVGPSVNSSSHEKSALFSIVKSILGYFPPPPFDLEMIIGQSRELFIVNEPNADNTRTYANIKAVTALPVGKPPLSIPAGFVRDKDKPVADRLATKIANKAARGQVPVAPGVPATTPTVAPQAAPVAATVPDEDIPF
jgi:hypothetical protein